MVLGDASNLSGFPLFVCYNFVKNRYFCLVLVLCSFVALLLDVSSNCK